MTELFDFSIFLQNSRHAANIANNESKWHFWSCEVMLAMQKHTLKFRLKKHKKIMQKCVKIVMILSFCCMSWLWVRFEVDFFRIFVDFGPFWDSDLEAFWDKSHEKMRLEKMMNKKVRKKVPKPFFWPLLGLRTNWRENGPGTLFGPFEYKGRCLKGAVSTTALRLQVC